jgi:hypothetical protein
VVKTERDVAQVSFEEGTAAFAETMRANVPNGDTPFRRAQLGQGRFDYTTDLGSSERRCAACAISGRGPG